MFSRLVRVLYSKVFIGVNLDLDACQIHIIRIKNGKTKQNIKTEIKCVDNQFPMEVLKLIYFYRKKYPFTYVGMLSKSKKQGALPEINLDNFLKFGINSKNLKIMSFQNTWSAYIEKEECRKLEGQIAESGGIDCLFSPFIPIYIQTQKEKQIMLYVLQEKNSASIAIASSEAVYYGGFFFLQDFMSSETTVSLESEEKSYEKILETLGVDLEDDIDELNDLELEEANLTQENERLEELNDFMRATTLATIIEQVIQEYYNNKNFQSVFIEKIVILDTYGMTSDSVKHIKETLMLNVEVKSFSIPHEITALMIREYIKGTL